MRSIRHGLGPVALLILSLVRRSFAVTLPLPLIIPPSQYFEGNDGPWSTFNLRAGTPSQVVRVLISTESPDTWLISNKACSTQTCTDGRGEAYNNASSSTAKYVDESYLHVEGNLNYTGTGYFGLDTLGFGLTASEGPTLNGQVVASITTEQFYLGIFGLNSQPTNFTLFNNTTPSFFQSLKDQNMIPSLTYAYTAGNPYRLKSVFGSLTLGGYDTSRFTSNGFTFPFAPDSERDLVVGLQSLQSTDSTGRTHEMLVEGGVLAFIDSTIPYIILPLSACEQFENILGITWNDDAGLYTISDSQHSSLTRSNYNFTFVLGNSANSGNSISIVLPYDSFDLTASAPLVNSSSRYFPLKRGSNETQYTLGRTFLQEAYLIADYERMNFSVSQCVFDASSKTQIQTIFPLGYVNPNPSNSTNGNGNGTSTPGGSSPSSPSSISTGAIAGIAVAGALILIGLILLVLARRNRRWPFHNIAPSGAAEIDGEQVGHEADGHAVPDKSYPMGNVYEADGKRNYNGTELEGNHVNPNAELEGHYNPKSELAGQGVDYKNSHNELAGTNRGYAGPHSELSGAVAASEVEGSGILMELAGSPVPVDYYGSKGKAASSQGNSRATSLRNEAIRRNDSAARSSPRGTAITASPISPPSATTSHRRPSGPPTSPLSDQEEPGVNSWLMGSVGAGPASREQSNTRGRLSRPEREQHRDVSPAVLGDSGNSHEHSGEVSRDPSMEPSRSRARSRATSGGAKSTTNFI